MYDVMDDEQDQLVTMAFPPKHPRAGFTGVLHGVAFKNGEAQLKESEAKQVAPVITRYFGAAIVGSPAYEKIAAEYAPASTGPSGNAGNVGAAPSAPTAPDTPPAAPPADPVTEPEKTSETPDEKSGKSGGKKS